jgi:hypothetical protein
MAFPLSKAWWASVFNLLLVWEDCTGECLGATWTMGLKVEEKENISLASHCVGRLLGGQSPTTHHFLGLQAVKRHKEALVYRELEGIGREAFQASVGLFPVQSN